MMTRTTALALLLSLPASMVYADDMAPAEAPAKPQVAEITPGAAPVEQAPVRPAPETKTPKPETVTPSEVPAKQADASVPRIDPQDLELLPLNRVEKLVFAMQHPALASRAQLLARRTKRFRDQLSKRKDKNDAGSKKLRIQLNRQREQVAKLVGNLLIKLKDKGFTPQVAQAMVDCPRGAYRIQRYAQHLVLVVPDLTDKQRALFSTVVERLSGAYQALLAQRERLTLSAQQADIDGEVRGQLRSTFDAQFRQNENRFWRLVDYALTETQRAKLGRSLPSQYREKANALEHLYRLPDLTPQQFARIQAIVTEAEAETSADKAAQARLRQAMKAKGIVKADRQRMRKELAAASKRLTELYVDTTKQTRAVLTEAQEFAWEAIPPRISSNDRRDRPERVLQGAPLTPEQRKRMNVLSKALKAEVRAVQKKRREVGRMGADYGPDSPQQMMMQSMMVGIEAEGATLTRKYLGKVFVDVMTPDQASGWVLGRFGYRR